MKHPVRYSILAAIGILIVIIVSSCGYKHYHSSIDDKAQYISEKIADKLELKGEQNLRLAKLKEEILIVVKEVRDNRQAHHKKILELLSQEQFDREQALKLINEKSVNIEEKATPIVYAFADFYDSLDSSQQQKLREKLAKHADSDWHKH